MRAPDGAPFAAHAQGVTLAVRLTPKSGRDLVEGIGAGADGRSHLKVRVRALPADGAANEALARLLAKWIGVPRGGVSLLSGATSRSKVVLVQGDARELAERLRRLLSARSA
ncbi:MAG: hypothetical protein BGN87_11160 [Rhizobiales bacterium 65-79]|jgi:uncharacterized protein (TIGR00251 family)|nr:DUF167 domain-containing protein [Hyphomicrobiales bacterium]OJU00518.1 MAG: hypothetical protein BGN87_11160 [Rhizobiales bacterium 65-79]HVW55940.1 DUF167 family protein [Rhizobiaceae bacterium]